MRPQLLLVLLLSAVPAAAQENEPKATSSAPVEGHDRGRLEHSTRTNNDAVTTGAAAREPLTVRDARIHKDATRLATLLRELETRTDANDKTWRRMVNEANTLANRIYARSRRAPDAAALRTRVRELRAAVDRSVALRHAGDARGFVDRVLVAHEPEATTAR